MPENRCVICGRPPGPDGLCMPCLLKTGFGEEGQTEAERLFRIALSFAPEERQAFVQQAAGMETGLREEVEMLLSGYAEAGGDAALPTLGAAPNAQSLWAKARREEPGMEIGHFWLVRLIGEGGMGSVWEAEQAAPIRRRVALKIIKLGMDTQEVVRRFERERRTLALMTHPNIAQVYEAGTTPAGRPYFAMELAEGQPITIHCAATRLDIRHRLLLFLEVCSAVEHAHQKGVIHRDLKPSNILVSGGRVKVIDFGVATATQEESGDGRLTRLAQVLGTPAYMSPEQAETEGRDVDTRSDVYSLGVVLYELLSGSPPFDPKRMASTGLREMQRILREESPPLPSSRLRHAPGLSASHPVELHGDLDWVVMKAISKERSRRYTGAAALAEDVGRYLEGRTVRAVPPTPAYRFGKFVRRNRAAVAAVGSIILALVSGLVTSRVQIKRTNEALAGQTEARLAATGAVADLYARLGLEADSRSEPSRAALWFAHAASAATDEERQEANRLRAATWTEASAVPVRAFETGLPHIEDLAFHPDGNALILTAVDASGARVMDLETEQPWSPAGAAVHSAAWLPDGSGVCVAGRGTVRVLAWPGGKVLAEQAAGPDAMLAVSPDGSTVAVGASPAFLWQWKSNRITPAAGLPGRMRRVRWSPDGQWILWQDLSSISICTAARPEVMLFPPLPNYHKTLADFAGTSGRFFHSAADGRQSLIREAATGAILTEVSGGGYAVALSPDARLLARSEGRLYEASGSERTIPFHRGNSLMESAQFSPDGSLLASVSYDGTARLWSVAGDRFLGLAGWHQHPVQCVAFSQDAKLVATSQIGLVRVWLLPQTPPVSRIPVGAGSLVTLSGDGRYVALCGLSQGYASQRWTQVFEVSTGLAAGPRMQVDGILTDSAFTPDGRGLALAVATTPERPQQEWTNSGGSGALEIRDWTNGQRTAGPVMLSAEPRALAIHPEGTPVASYTASGELLEWDATNGMVKSLYGGGKISLPNHLLHNGRCAFAGNGRYLLAWGQLEVFHLFDRATGQAIPTPPLPPNSVIHGLALHGQTAALLPAGPPAALVRLLGLATGREAAAALAHSDWLYAAAFNDTGDLLLTTGRRPVAQVWHWKTGTLAGPALTHEAEVMSGLFLPGKPWVITGAQDGTIRFWDSRSGMPLRPALPVGGMVMQLILARDARHLIAAGFVSGGDILVYPSAPLFPSQSPDHDPEATRLCAELNAAATVHTGSGLTLLTGEGWLAKWQDFRRRYPAWPGHQLASKRR